MARLIEAVTIATFLSLLARIVISQECTERDIRLVTDSAFLRNKESNVKEYNFPEYCVNGTWRRACTGDGRWRIPHADLACKQLGFTGRVDDGGACSVNYTGGYFRIRMRNCQPVIQENLDECGIDPLEECDCTGVDQTRNHGWAICANCNDGEVRLVGGTNSSGRLEVCTDGLWGTVCDNNQPQEIAEAACNQLGLGEANITAADPGFLPIRSCTVGSDDIIICTGIDDGSCDHSMDLGIQCSDEIFTEQSTTEPSEEPTTIKPTTEPSTTEPSEEPTTEPSTTEPSEEPTTEDETTQLPTTQDLELNNSTGSDDSGAVAGLATLTAILAVTEVVVITALALVCKALRDRHNRTRTRHSGSREAREIHYYHSADREATPTTGEVQEMHYYKHAQNTESEATEHAQRGEKYVPLIDGPTDESALESISGLMTSF